MVRFNLRQNPHRQAVRIQRFTIYFSRTASDGGWLDRSIGLIVPPPIPVGGAPYAVTHSRRKYHHPRMCLMASVPAWSRLRRWWCSLLSSRRCSPFPGGISPRTRRLASHIRNVSARPIQLYASERPRQPSDRNTFSDRAPLLIDGKGPPAKYPVSLEGSYGRPFPARGSAPHGGDALRPNGNVRAGSPPGAPGNETDPWRQTGRSTPHSTDHRPGASGGGRARPGRG